jgi:hypothetical protein
MTSASGPALAERLIYHYPERQYRRLPDSPLWADERALVLAFPLGFTTLAVGGFACKDVVFLLHLLPIFQGLFLVLWARFVVFRCLLFSVLTFLFVRLLPVLKSPSRALYLIQWSRFWWSCAGGSCGNDSKGPDHSVLPCVPVLSYHACYSFSFILICKHNNAKSNMSLTGKS